MVARFGGLPPVVILAVFFLGRGGGDGGSGDGRLGGFPPVLILAVIFLTGRIGFGGAGAIPVSPVDVDDTTSTTLPSLGIFFT